MALLLVCDICQTTTPSKLPDKGWVSITGLYPNWEGYNMPPAFDQKHVCGPQCLIVHASNLKAEEAVERNRQEMQDAANAYSPSEEDDPKKKKG